MSVVKFEVFDGGRAAKYPDCNVDPSWNSNVFDLLTDAIKYADNWLGPMSPGIKVLSEKAVNIPYDYDGYGDIIEIKAVEQQT